MNPIHCTLIQLTNECHFSHRPYPGGASLRPAPRFHIEAQLWVPPSPAEDLIEKMSSLDDIAVTNPPATYLVRTVRATP